MHKQDNIYIETIRHLRHVSTGRYELVEPHLLYLKPQQANEYLTRVMADFNYREEGFHDDLVTIVKDYARIILARPRCHPERFDLADLGPGYPDKTLPLLGAAPEAGISQISYMPVDVSDKYLAIAAQAVLANISDAIVYPEKAKFESLTAERFRKRGLVEPNIFLGLTYMNFPSEKIGALLKDLSTKDSIVMVASELLTRRNASEHIAARYADEQIRRFTFGPIANLGYSFEDFESDVRFNNLLGRVEVAFTYKRPSPVDVLGGVLNIGDEVISFVSYRYAKEELDQRLAPYFSRRDLYVAPSGNTALAVCAL